MKNPNESGYDRVKRIKKTKNGIAKIMKDKGYNQKQIAEGYGCSQSTVSVALGICEDVQFFVASTLGFNTWKELCKEGIKKEKKINETSKRTRK